ncbi:MAG: hypothetical protein JNM78_02035 [Cyclobacteriaceae bacterium]|nr:hypothetical protein [Cyclobacteriaceae bacterium]
MKQLILSSYILLTLAGCIDPEIKISKSQNITTIDKLEESLAYKLSPSAADQLTISFLNNQNRDFESLTLMQGDAKLATFDFIRDPFGGQIFSADVKYQFKEGEFYDFLIASKEILDTVFVYHLKNYKHIYTQKFNYHKIDNWTHLHEYDFDPNRKFLFVTDFDNNKFILKKISLEDNTVFTLPNNFSGAPIRVISDNEIISYSLFYNNHYLKGDSAALLKYNLSTGTTQFLDWISADYIMFSRVVNDHVMFNNPIFTSKTSTLIDLSDDTKTVLSNSDINTLRFRSETFDNLYSIDNNIFDWSSTSFVKKINIPEKAFISYIDEVGQFSFVIETVSDLNYSNYQSRLLVYKGIELLHQGNFEENCQINLGKIIKPVDNKIIFFKNYGLSHSPKISGYYSFDLRTGETALVHCDEDNSAIRDFTLNDNTFLSVRSQGLYKITTN